MKILDDTGLTYLWGKITAIFAKKADLSTVASTGDYDDLSNKPSVPSVAVEQSASPGNTTITVDGISRVIVQDLIPTGSTQAYVAPSWGALDSLTSGKANASEMAVSTSGDQTTITLKSGTSATVINSHQDISGKANSADLADVATSGSYTDIVDAPQYVICTLAEYNAMASHDADTYYIIIAEPNE